MTRLILFNKPFGVLSQFTGGERGETLAGYVDVPGVYAAGRLDRDSEGLLVLTDDGQLQARIASPRFKLPKTYLAQVEGAVAETALSRLRTGVELKDGMTLPARANRIEPPALWPRDPPIRYRRNVADQWLSITITEGRNRQVRRMTAAIGHPTLRLVRWSVGPWSLDNIASGTWQQADDPWASLGSGQRRGQRR